MGLKRNKLQQQSEEWFRNLLKQNVNKKAAEEYSKGNRKSVSPGAMYQMNYTNPKTKLTSDGGSLKVYDAFPLIIMFAKRGNDMWGVNLHFLPKIYKETFLKLVIQMNKANIRADKRFKLEYKQVRMFLKRNGLESFVVKRYKVNRITNFKYIPYRDWRYALNLPTEKFVRAEGFSKDDFEKLLRSGIAKSKASKNKRFGR